MVALFLFGHIYHKIIYTILLAYNGTVLYNLSIETTKQYILEAGYHEKR